MSRADDRSEFSETVRLRLIEGDLDSLEGKLDAMDKRLGKIMAAVMTTMASMIVAAIMLALNLAVGP